MSIFKNKMTTAEAFAGIKTEPTFPPTMDEMRAAIPIAYSDSETRFAAMAGQDERCFVSPRNRMNVQHPARPRRGHDY